MLSLRHKFLLGFGGLLTIMVIVVVIALGVIKLYGEAIDRTMHENYRSVQYGENMKEALQRMNYALQEALWDFSSNVNRTVEAQSEVFEAELVNEENNITLPNERETVTLLRKSWQEYRRIVPQILDSAVSVQARRAVFREQLLPVSHDVNRQAQAVVDMNVGNMLAVDGEAKQEAQEAKRIMIALVLAGTLLALILLYVTGRAILKPLRVLTDSVNEIQRGNLNLVVPAHSRDEVGQLMTAFNEMAAQLREFHRGERAQLVRTQRSAQAVIECFTDGVAIVNVKGEIELANSAAQTFFGLKPEVNLTTRKDDILRRLFFSALMLEQSTEKISINNALQAFQNGEEKFFLPRAMPIKNEDNATIGVALVLADVTRLRRVTELEIEPISVVSHELKTPLTSVRMALHMLFDDRIGALNTKQSELLTAAKDDSDQLNRIIENLLDISKIESGRVRMNLKSISASAMLSELQSQLQPAFESAGVRLETTVPSDIPDFSADSGRLPHVLTNLLTNALRHSTSGQTVRVRVSQDQSFVRFEVIDEGKGIPAEAQRHIFERFYRVEHDSTAGVGLGLAIAKEIVQAHGGSIKVESVPGFGAKFSFTIPLETS